MLVLVVVNKYSRSGDKNNIDYIIKRLKEKYNIVSLFVATKEYTIASYIKSYGKAYNLICVVGGDGTIHEVVNSVMCLNHKPIIALIPTGTCNDIAHTLGIPRKLDKAIDIILEESLVELSIYKMNDTYFIYGLAGGLLSEVSYFAKKEDKIKYGKLAYYLEALKNINRIKPIRAKIDNIVEDYSFLLCLNSHYLAGFKIKYKNKRYLNDNNMKLILIKKSNRLMELFDLGCFFILGEYYKHNTTIDIVSKLKIEALNQISLNADGEAIGKAKSLDISTLDNTIMFVVNKKFKNKIIK